MIQLSDSSECVVEIVSYHKVQLNKYGGWNNFEYGENRKFWVENKKKSNSEKF